MGLWHDSDVGRMDELGRLDSPVHRLDARVKALTTTAFLVTVMSFPRYEVSALLPFVLYPVTLMAVGGIPPGCMMRKLLVAAPFALAVGIFNPLLDRQAVAILGTHTLSGGWLSLASIVVRFMLTVSAALTLVACTGIHRLCAALERLGAPQVFTIQLELLYRYLFVIVGEGARMRRAAELRSAGRGVLRLRTAGALVGNLLLRAMDRAQRVYQAMNARGFDGRVRVLRPTALRAGDFAFLAGWLAFFAVARSVNIARGLGAFVTEKVCES
jgi:cobalt/nickel transport system permease protein